MSPSEFFTYQLYSFELRLKGLLVFDESIELEPPYIPFRRIYPSTFTVDESHKPTFFSKLFSKKKKNKHIESEALDYETIEPFVSNIDTNFIVYVFHIPKQRTTDISTSFLASLSYTLYPISFEIVAKEGHIQFQFVVHAVDALIVESIIATHFNEFPYTKKSDVNSLQILPPDTDVNISEYSLSQEVWYPIEMYEKKKSEPLLQLLYLFSQLKENEHAGLQILFHKTLNNWKESIITGVTLRDGSSFFENDSLAPKSAQLKTQSPLFSVCVRTFTVENYKKRPLYFALLQCISSLSNSSLNSLVPIQSMRNNEIVSDIYLRETHRLGMLLSAEELTTLVHLPSKACTQKELYTTSRKTLKTAQVYLNKEHTVGINTFNEQNKEITLSNNDKSKHIHIIGATGTGKSTLLVNLVLSDIKNNNAVVVFDPHGDLITDIQSRIPEKEISKVVLLDPSDTEFPFSLNILYANTEEEKIALATDIVSTFRRNSTSWGDQMNTVLSNALLAFLDNTIIGTLHDVRRFLLDEEYKREVLQTCTDISIVYFWNKEYPLLKTSSIGPIVTRLDSFLRPKLIRNLVSQKDGISFDSLLDKGSVILINLPIGSIGYEHSYTLASLLVSQLHISMLRRHKKQVRNFVSLYLDEFQNFITPSISELISGIRKFNVGLVLSHQTISQLTKTDSDVLSSILGNISTRICFRVGEADAKRLLEGMQYIEPIDIQNLSVGEAFIRFEKPEYTTSLNTFPLPKENHNAENFHTFIIDASRRLYSKPKHEVERYIEKSLRESLSKKHTQIQETEKVENLEIEKVEDATNNKKEQRIVPVSPPLDTLDTTKRSSTHIYLQNLIKKVAEHHGYICTLEKALSQSTGNVDVVLVKNNTTIAIELCITTDSTWEAHNIQKCIQENFTHVYSVSGDPKQLVKIKEACIKESIDISLVSFLTPDVLFTHLAQSNTPPITEESPKMMKGYRVKVSYDTTQTHNTKHKEKAIKEVIKNAIKKK